MMKLIVIAGPTAVGKTDTGISLAKEFNGEVISGDSMQVYKGMDIGTAKVTPEEMEGVPHHLIDIKDPRDSFSAAEFQERARQLIEEINNKGKLPIIVGGTGLYLNAVIYDYDFSETEGDPEYRKEMEEFARQHGAEALHNKLKSIDPDSYGELHPNNVRRIIRALEVYKLTGKTIAERPRQPDKSPYDTALIGLTMERELLYERINKRVDLMVDQGLIEESERLYNAGIKECQSVQAIGYKEIYEFLEGRLSREDAIELLKRNSRRYAKRQLTWFRNKMDLTWFDMAGDREKKLKEIHQFVKESCY
ncbi:tRNA (adenosine(37)-N6)-dimethylallyltransferase MiaA [Evansella sp. LMS18]|jgi:tRNA dimethylallyltransferase|nr:tRNA (adenosine(37)-N6)-dimethylallyltransferase MiaA [Evansella sp. LMS18]UTR10786.1 tRNA (adenosine(37)-N6)-dimethylallyltransferase MiaA [Evansella sp. LMS18]